MTKLCLFALALILLAVTPAPACDYFVGTPSVGLVAVPAYYTPPPFSYGYIAAPLSLAYPVYGHVGYPGFSYSDFGVVRSRSVFVDRGFGFRSRDLFFDRGFDRVRVDVGRVRVRVR